MIIKTCTECSVNFNAKNNKIFLCCDTCKNSYYKKVKGKRKNTCLDKYDCENPMQNENIKEKRKNTCLSMYNVSNVSKNLDVIKKLKKIHSDRTPEHVKEIVNKRKNTCLDKYDCEHPMQNEDVKEKYIKTCITKYKSKWYMGTNKFKEKSINTCIEKYDCENPMQNEKVFNKQQKSSYHNKNYTLPSGKDIKIQGYENNFLDEYFSNGGLENDIIIHPTQKNIGKIWYTKIGKKSRYFPDFYIKSTNTIIEVKSTWTYSKDLHNNLLKEQSCINNGYNFEFKIYTKPTSKLER